MSLRVSSSNNNNNSSSSSGSHLFAGLHQIGRR